MIPAAFPRSVAIALLRFAIWIAPARHPRLGPRHAQRTKSRGRELVSLTLVTRRRRRPGETRHRRPNPPRHPSPHRLHRQRTLRKGRSHAQTRSRDHRVLRQSPLSSSSSRRSSAKPFAFLSPSGTTSSTSNHDLATQNRIQHWTLSQKRLNKIATPKGSRSSRLATQLKRKGYAWPTKPFASIQISPGSMQ